VETRELARSILRYLDEHPEANDTLDGIAQWWLLREWSERKVMDVQRAVGFLLSKDLVVEARIGRSPPFYRVNQEKSEEISKILRKE